MSKFEIIIVIKSIQFNSKKDKDNKNRVIKHELNNNNNKIVIIIIIQINDVI
jgi:hypothetical protein